MKQTYCKVIRDNSSDSTLFANSKRHYSRFVRHCSRLVSLKVIDYISIKTRFNSDRCIINADTEVVNAMIKAYTYIWQCVRDM